LSQRKCNAKSKRTKERCGANAMAGKEKCYHHGGRSRTGALHPNFKTGIYSKYLPARFGKLFDALNDSDILDLTEDAKLLKVRILDLAKRVDPGETGALWRKAFELYQAIAKAKDTSALMIELGQVLQSGVSDFDAWEAIEELVVKRVKVVESQRKRAVEANEMLTSQDAREMMRAITEAVKLAVEEHVTDEKLKRKIFTTASSKFAGIVNPGHHQLVSASDH
jgi:hypothetical protein